MNKVKRSFLFFAVVGILCKLIGGAYRIPLTNILGAEGVGVYQLIFSVYAMVLALTSGAIPVYLSRELSILAATNRHDEEKRVFNTALFSIGMISLTVAVALVCFARPLAALQGIENAYVGYYAIAPSVLLVGLSACYRGWFNSKLQINYTALSQFAEQVIKFVCGLILVKLFIHKGILYATVLALVGVTISEFFSTIFLAIAFRAKGNRISGGLSQENGIFSKAFPLIVGNMVMPITAFVDGLLVVKLLSLNGYTQSNAVSLFGLLTGGANTVTSFPTALTLALATTVIPLVATSYGKRDVDGIRNKSSVTLKYTLALAIPAALGIAMLSRPISEALFPSLSANSLTILWKLLAITSVNIVLLSLLQAYTSLLNSLTFSKYPTAVLAISSFIKLLLCILLTPRIGIYGVAISSSVCYLAAFLADALYYSYLIGKMKKVSKWLLQTLAAGAIMLASIFPIANNLSGIAATCLGIAIGGIVYATSLLIFRFFENEELNDFAVGRLVLRFNKLIRRNK